jgi:hypothetical protein
MQAYMSIERLAKRGIQTGVLMAVASVALCGCLRDEPSLPAAYSNSSLAGLSIALTSSGSAAVAGIDLNESRNCFEHKGAGNGKTYAGEAKWAINQGALKIEGPDWRIEGYFDSGHYGTDWSELHLLTCDGGYVTLFDSR